MRADKLEALSVIDRQADFFRELADEIWDHPELSLKEYRAAALYCRKLRELGFEVTEKLWPLRQRQAGDRHSGRI